MGLFVLCPSNPTALGSAYSSLLKRNWVTLPPLRGVGSGEEGWWPRRRIPTQRTRSRPPPPRVLVSAPTSPPSWCPPPELLAKVGALKVQAPLGAKELLGNWKLLEGRQGGAGKLEEGRGHTKKPRQPLELTLSTGSLPRSQGPSPHPLPPLQPRGTPGEETKCRCTWSEDHYFLRQRCPSGDRRTDGTAVGRMARTWVSRTWRVLRGRLAASWAGQHLGQLPLRTMPGARRPLEPPRRTALPAGGHQNGGRRRPVPAQLIPHPRASSALSAAWGAKDFYRFHRRKD